MNILGISAFYHDSAAALLTDGKIAAAAQEERFSRIKHDPRFPENAILYCLDQAGVTIDDVKYVVFYDKPFLTFDRLLMTYLSVAPKGLLSWLAAMPKWLGQNLHVAREIKRRTNYNGPVLYTEHHEAHAASAFYPSPFDHAAILTMDGVGEWATASYGFGAGKDISLIKELHFPDSLGLLYSAFTYFTGFRVNSGEYKLMGLAPYGEPCYKDIILTELIDLKQDGSMRANMSYFDFLGGTKMTNRRFSKLFGGPPRKPESEITKREMDIAASIQAVTEEAVLKTACHVHRETGEKNLVMAGGVALNCVANGKVLRKSPFKNIWIQPAAGDAGGALGAAMSVWHRVCLKERTSSVWKGPYLGPDFSNQQIREFLDAGGFPYHELTDQDRAKTVAHQIASGKIVGYMVGRMEFGPRALGARSILGDPKNPDTQLTMNLKIKFRESFRPFAPAVLEEKAHEYFDLDCPSPYMLLVAPVIKERRLAQPDPENLSMQQRLKAPRSDLPAITHLDYSARLQTVNKNEKPDFHEVIFQFEKITGCAVVVNTSFNVRGEPIVCSPQEAFHCFMRTEMDILVMENFILFKEEQPLYEGEDKGKYEALD